MNLKKRWLMRDLKTNTRNADKQSLILFLSPMNSLMHFRSSSDRREMVPEIDSFWSNGKNSCTNVGSYGGLIISRTCSSKKKIEWKTTLVFLSFNFRWVEMNLLRIQNDESRKHRYHVVPNVFLYIAEQDEHKNSWACEPFYRGSFSWILTEKIGKTKSLVRRQWKKFQILREQECRDRRMKLRITSLTVRRPSDVEESEDWRSERENFEKKTDWKYFSVVFSSSSLTSSMMIKWTGVVPWSSLK